MLLVFLRNLLAFQLIVLLQHYRYLIVIDDVWDKSAWEILKCVLIDNHYGSRVIVTTRNLDVGNYCASSVRGSVYELEPLSYEDSKTLFYRRVFKEEEGIGTKLNEVAGKILKKCGGLPLAITTIAGLLACKPKTKAEWYAVYNSICSGPDKPKDNMETMRVILSLSFTELPSHLKPCLLYLSFFPEDCIINKDSLVRRWVAEGLIDEKHGGKKFHELWERGEGYFVDLVNRSFIQPLDIDLEGIASTCRVHDIILDLLISLSIQENFVVRSDYVELINPLVCKIRRLSLQDNSKKQEIVPPTVELSHVRSVIAFGDAFRRMPPLSRFSVLRVLDLEGFPSKNNCPKDLRNLHHLRYLQLRGYLKNEVLEEIGNLRHLEVLDISNAGLEHGLPASIVNITSLQSLLIDYSMRMPDGIGKLSLLQELSWITVAPNTVAELGKLAALRVLCICGLGFNESIDKAFVQSLSNLRNLVDLFITRSGLCSLDLDGLSESSCVPAHLKFFRGTSTTFHQLPRWFSKLELLSGLIITVNKFTQYDLEMLGQLPSLRFLELEVYENSNTQERLMIGNVQHFQSLEEVKFFHREGCLMVFAEGVMPMLQKLEFYFQLRKRVGGGLDIGLENLTSLKHVTVKVDCYKAKIMEVEDVETMFEDAVRIHPNYPTLKLSRVREWQMAEGYD